MGTDPPGMRTSRERGGKPRAWITGTRGVPAAESNIRKGTAGRLADDRPGHLRGESGGQLMLLWLSSTGEVGAVEFSAYQRAARETSQLRLGGTQGAIAPMLGLASETGSILNIYKKYLRDGIDLAANRDFLREELGDLLWYAAAVATACGLDLEEVAEANLRRARDRYPRQRSEPRWGDLPVLDAGYPARERFPRRLVVAFAERVLPSGRRAASLTLVSAEPNAFPDGPVTVAGKTAGFGVGGELGDPLTDNSRRADIYRLHDAINLGFM